MITEQTRRCASCSNLLDGSEPACPTCGRVLAPPIAEWGEHAKRLIYLLTIVDALDLQVGKLEQQQFEYLLERTMRGRWRQGRLVPQAATVVDCLAEFVKLYRDWEAAGSPTAFAAIAAVRGGR